MEKILICAPTAAAKNYCAKEWLLNINKFTYAGGFEVVVFDNTQDGGANAKYLNELADGLSLSYSYKAFWVPSGKKVGLIERLCMSHNECRLYAIAKGFYSMLHLETDVMPEPDVIEKLLSHRKSVVGALYYRDQGRSRKLMLQRHIHRAPRNIISVNFGPQDDVCFIDGTLKKVSHAGLGCLLIHSSVLAKFPFRFKHGVDISPDSYFAEDCFRYGINIYADTYLMCRHQNEPWGNYGIDYK